MVSLLDLPEVRARISPVSVEEYHRMGEFNEHGRRTELIRGLVIEKARKSPLHSAIVTRLYRKILELVPAGYVVRKEEPLTLADSEPEPDISVVATPTGEDFSRSHPISAELVIEVADSSAALDRAKASLYAEAGVEEYWIVICASHTLEIYWTPQEGAYLNKMARRIDKDSHLSVYRKFTTSRVMFFIEYVREAKLGSRSP